jgi:IclR family transcriptional regulator, KDG regulon repressor
VQLAVFDAGFTVYVDKVDSPHALKAMTSIGSRLPATVTSTGKAVLAWLPMAALDVSMTHVKKFTANTLTKRKDIEQDLAETRERGYSVNRGEFREGVAGIAVPVRDRTGQVVASLGVWGAEANILGARREELAQLAMAAARDISRELGHIEAATAVARRPKAEVAA